MTPNDFHVQLSSLVERICASGVFGANEQLPKLLRYLSSNTIAKTRITARDLAEEFLPKKRGPWASRETAARGLIAFLKSRLAQYYREEGRNEAVQIEIKNKPYQ